MTEPRCMTGPSTFASRRAEAVARGERPELPAPVGDHLGRRLWVHGKEVDFSRLVSLGVAEMPLDFQGRTEVVKIEEFFSADDSTLRFRRVLPHGPLEHVQVYAEVPDDVERIHVDFEVANRRGASYYDPAPARQTDLVERIS